MAKTVPYEGAVGCRGKVVPKCYSCDRAPLCAAHKDGLCVPCQQGEEPEGWEEEELVEDPNGVTIEHVLSACFRRNNHRAFFFVGVGGVAGGGCPPQ